MTTQSIRSSFIDSVKQNDTILTVMKPIDLNQTEFIAKLETSDGYSISKHMSFQDSVGSNKPFLASAFAYKFAEDIEDLYLEDNKVTSFEADDFFHDTYDFLKSKAVVL